MVRHQLLWAAWFEAVGLQLDDPDVVPGESGSGLGLFVRALAGSEVEIATLPVSVRTAGDTGSVAFVPLDGDVDALVARLIPFPVGPSPGSRQRVRILDGTGQLNNGLPAAPLLVEAGAEIATVGNARSFDYRTTQFVVGAEVDQQTVERITAAFGAGDVVTTEEAGSAVDVTVILGEDVVRLLGGPFASVGGIDE